MSSLKTQIMSADDQLLTLVKTAADKFIATGFKFPALNILDPKVIVGTIISGDQFINSPKQHQELCDKMKDVLTDGRQFDAVEMEGAALAQVCSIAKMPFVVVRSISDDQNVKTLSHKSKNSADTKSAAAININSHETEKTSSPASTLSAAEQYKAFREQVATPYTIGILKEFAKLYTESDKKIAVAANA